MIRPIGGVILWGWLLCVTTQAAADTVTLVVEKPLPSAGVLALDALRAALVSQGHAVQSASALPTDGGTTLVVGIAGQSKQVDQALKDAQTELSHQPESLAVARVASRPDSFVIAGRDERGLAYALRDVARGIELAGRGSTLASVIHPAVESPLVPVRNISIHLFNADLDASWYYAEDFWSSYFSRLSLDRFNRFTLTFSDQTNYLCPLYAYLVEMPEYPAVRVSDCSAADRQRNLAMLRRISQLARDHGLGFNLGIWMQAPVPRYSAPVRVTGLPEGAALAEYGSLGLRRILETCPAIDGVQLRINAEAGVAESQQTSFYRPTFATLAKIGRPVRLELRYKGLLPATTQAAIDAGLDVTVSTKFWAEHLGLPYHPTSVDSHWRLDRYSFGAMLRKPRGYHVAYQLWNVGSQRLTLWGDPSYAAALARNCRLADGDGIEVFAPLSDKGYGDRPGAWSIYRDPSLRVGRWEQDRYWFFYLCFGRLSYNADTSPEVWQREFRARFGAVAGEVELACRAASQVLPLVTAARLPGASEWSWWPEMDTGGSLRPYMFIQPSDPAQFYAIRRWQPNVPGWRWETWDAVPGYVEDVLQGRLCGKTTPPEVAHRLHELSRQIEASWASAARAGSTLTAEWRTTEIDVKLLAALAEFHAEKLLAATELAFFEIARQPGRLAPAREHQRRAVEAWRKIVTITTPAYHDNLVFGVAPDSPRSTLGHHHTGHWRDRLAEVEADLAFLDDLLAREPAATKPYQPMAVERASPPQFHFAHEPPSKLPAGKDFAVRVRVAGSIRPRGVILHYRPLDQTRDWQELSLDAVGSDEWAAALPADQIDAHFDFQFYFEAFDAHRGALWPSWQQATPYFVVKVGESPQP